MKPTQPRISENNMLIARANAEASRFERIDFPHLSTRRPEPHPAEVPNRLFGATINEEGDAV